MPESMDPQLVGQLNVICDGYARRQKLSDDDRQEVLSHLQDSLEGYLTGQTRVTPEDALLLARARLGDVKGLVSQLRAVPADNDGRRTRLRVALLTGFLTVIVFPAVMILLSPPVGSYTGLFRASVLLSVCLLITQTGVYLTARVNMHSRWQRATALVLILPTIMGFSLMLMNTTQSGLLPTSATSAGGAALMRGLAIACLAGHSLLALMLMAPRKHEASPALE